MTTLENLEIVLVFTPNLFLLSRRHVYAISTIEGNGVYVLVRLPCTLLTSAPQELESHFRRTSWHEGILLTFDHLHERCSDIFLTFLGH